ncbi:MAG: PAS domain-containing protein [Gluconacetobacter diazotrophicus]|nr:PAS domain-containing protein [Gluconacetobacter diazotrophicus]
MARRIRAHDWATTSLGPIGRWPAALRAMLSMVLDHPLPMALAWGPNLATLHNDAYAPLLDGGPDALGRPFPAVWGEAWGDADPPVALRLARVAAGQGIRIAGVRCRRPRGEPAAGAVFDHAFSPVRDEAGAVVGVLDTAVETGGGVRPDRDGTAANAAPCDGEARFRALVTRTSDAVYRVDADWFELRGLDGGNDDDDDDGTAGPGGGWMERRVHPDDRAEVAAAIEVAIRDRRPFEMEHRVRRPDGGVGWMLSRAVPLLDEAGRIIEWFGAADDVTDRKHAEQALADSEGRLRKLMEGVPQLVWRSCARGRWTWASPQWVAYTGQTAEESSGEGWLDALHPDDRDAARDAWTRAAADGVLQVDCRIRHAPSGQYKWFQTRGVPIRDADGAVAEWLGTCTDIDDQMRAREVLARSGEGLERQVAARTADLMAAEAWLRQSEKLTAIGQLTGGIAHDFNNMLQGLGSSLDLVREAVERGDHAEIGLYIERAERSAERAAALTHRLLAFSRDQELDPKALAVDHVVRDMAELIRRTVGPALQLELQLADGRWLVWCDPNQLENALLNLCINARDAMPDGGWLTVGTQEVEVGAVRVAPHEGAAAGRYVALSVRDAGSGIPPGVLERVFEPFFTTKPMGSGTGLGLSQVYGFVRQSGGFVEIDTSVEAGPQRGTTVRLLFPFHAENPDAATDPHPGRAAPTVLLVEDQPDIRGGLAALLRRRGFRVLEAADGPSVLRLVNSGTALDLLLTDQGLPGGMTGLQVIAQVRERHPTLPALLTTGFANAPVVPGVAVLRKPFRTLRLLEAIETLLPGTTGTVPDRPGD